MSKFLESRISVAGEMFATKETDEQYIQLLRVGDNDNADDIILLLDVDELKEVIDLLQATLETYEEN